MIICVESDYGGYFEAIARKIVSLAPNPKYKRMIVTAGPYRLYALTVDKVDDETVQLDFYSAIRAGFGSLSENDLIEAAKLI
jgi:hypothetical protein